MVLSVVHPSGCLGPATCCLSLLTHLWKSTSKLTAQTAELATGTLTSQCSCAFCHTAGGSQAGAVREAFLLTSGSTTRYMTLATSIIHCPVLIQGNCAPTHLLIMKVIGGRTTLPALLCPFPPIVGMEGALCMHCHSLAFLAAGDG